MSAVETTISLVLFICHFIMANTMVNNGKWVNMLLDTIPWLYETMKVAKANTLLAAVTFILR